MSLKFYLSTGKKHEYTDIRSSLKLIADYSYMANSVRKTKVKKRLNSAETIEESDSLLQKEHRCISCNKLLGVEHLQILSFDIKCVRCGYINSVDLNCNRQVILTDKDGIILYVNEEVEKVTGYSKKEILGEKPAIWGNNMSKEFYQDMWHKISYILKTDGVTNLIKDSCQFSIDSNEKSSIYELSDIPPKINVTEKYELPDIDYAKVKEEFSKVRKNNKFDLCITFPVIKQFA